MHDAFIPEMDGNLYAIDSPSSCPNYGGTSGLSLRDQDDQLQMLRKENFHLKLRIYFLQQTQCGKGKQGFFENNQIDNEKIELKVSWKINSSEVKCFKLYTFGVLRVDNRRSSSVWIAWKTNANLRGSLGHGPDGKDQTRSTVQKPRTKKPA